MNQDLLEKLSLSPPSSAKSKKDDKDFTIFKQVYD